MKNILIIFGSESDASTYLPIYETLKRDFNPTLEICSAHRHANRLRDILRNSDYSCVLAGAGLAAHLPGVVA